MLPGLGIWAVQSNDQPKEDGRARRLFTIPRKAAPETERG